MNNFEHLEMPLVFTGKPIFKSAPMYNERTVYNKNNRQIHGKNIRHQAQEISKFWSSYREDRIKTDLPIIESGIPIMLEIEPDTDIEFLRGLGFEIVSEVDNGFVLVSSEDINLELFNEKINKFIENTPKSGRPASVYGLKTNSERMQVIMSESLREKWNKLTDSQIYLVEVSISCNGKVVLPKKPTKNNNESEEHYSERIKRWDNKCQSSYIEWDCIEMERQNELENIVSYYNGKIYDTFMENIEGYVRFPDSFTTKIEINGKGLKDLVSNYPYIFEIVLLEDIIIAHNTDTTLPIDLNNISIESPDTNSPIIGIIDSGIQKNALTLPAIYEEESYIKNDDSTDDKVSNGGHGTRVAGIALTHDLDLTQDIKLPFRIRNIRVLDDKNCLRKEIAGPGLISSIIKKYNIEATTKTRIFNHSIGEEKECELVHMSSWASAIDKYSYENDILFIQSAGNIKEDKILFSIQNGVNYPDYLEHDFARICNPAQSLQALTVGSISPSNYDCEDVTALGQLDEPSAFSRSGPGIWDSIKPDIVEYGGTYALNTKNSIPKLEKPSELCVRMPRKILNKKIFSQDQIGTSFSTPMVTSIAGKLESIFPNASTLLYRGLIIQSAKWPTWANHTKDKSQVLRRIGYGIPSLESATTNDEYRVTLYADNMQINANDAHIYKVPIPQNLRNIGDNFDIRIQVTLSYNANPRNTRRRIKGYLSTWLEWSCSRLGEDYETFKKRIFQTGKRDELDEGDLKWMIGSQRNYGQADNFSKTFNTIQKDWAIIKSSDFPEDFCLAVRAHKGWSEKFPANYALIVTFEAVNRDLELYNEIRTAIEVEIENSRSRIEINNTNI